MRKRSSIALGKGIYWALRKSGRHGAALPGLVVEKVNPKLINILRDLPEGIIVVSGTNGKTTTTHMIAHALTKKGLRVFTNKSGSNMTRGLLATIVRHADIKKGTLPFDVAVLEIDEAYAAKLAPMLKPRITVLINVLRDQLDRFGEIDHTARLLGVVAQNTTDKVIVNAHDGRLLKCVIGIKATVVTFGHIPKLAEFFPSDDDWHTSQVTNNDVSADYELQAADESVFKIKSKHKRWGIDTQMTGWHNAINMTAAVACLDTMYPGLDILELFSGLSAPYGRGELVKIRDCELTLQLVKNPSGFRIAMSIKQDQPAMIVINDDYADSRDVSWLWDVPVEALGTRPYIMTTGTRAYDMAVRLKYADISVTDIDTDIEKSILKFINLHKQGVIFLTYTAMLQVRTFLDKLRADGTHKK